jgi:hypothetical protein
MRAQNKINFMKGIDEHMRIRKESNMINSENPKNNNGKTKEFIVSETIWKITKKITRSSKHLSVSLNSSVKRHRLAD